MTQFYNSFWQRNLLVCFIGSFSTVFAMTLMLPFLPLYVEELGVSGHAAVVQWSGVAFSATFITAGLIAPVWGKLGDRYGRKSMLVRASLGMAVTVSLMGLVTNIWQLMATCRTKVVSWSGWWLLIRCDNSYRSPGSQRTCSLGVGDCFIRCNGGQSYRSTCWRVATWSARHSNHVFLCRCADISVLYHDPHSHSRRGAKA